MVPCAVTVGIQMKRIKQILSCLLALLLVLSAVACTGKTNDPADTGVSGSLTVPEIPERMRPARIVGFPW